MAVWLNGRAGAACLGRTGRDGHGLERQQSASSRHPAPLALFFPPCFGKQGLNGQNCKRLSKGKFAGQLKTTSKRRMGGQGVKICCYFSSALRIAQVMLLSEAGAVVPGHSFQQKHPSKKSQTSKPHDDPTSKPALRARPKSEPRFTGQIQP